MDKPTIQPISDRNLEVKYETIDSLDIIPRCAEKSCQQSIFCIGHPNCRIFNIKNLKYYFINKLEDLKLQSVQCKSHFKEPCFNCSSSFHYSSFADGNCDLQKMYEVGKGCVSCQRYFTTERSFYHICNICNVSFKNCRLLFRHRTRKHKSAKKPHQCAVCNLSLSEYALRRHILTKHKLPHKCRFCSKRYATKLNLELHTLSHNGEKQFSCKYCPKQYRSKYCLDIHILDHTGGKQFKCNLCDKNFATRYLLERHSLIHMERSFHCEYCPKQYKSKSSLDIHIFEHVGGKKFKCDLCDKTFATHHLLKLHLPAHIERYNFQCKQCTKQYKSKKSLDLHLLEHADGKKFKCDLCDKNFSTQHAVKRHKRVHMEKLYECNYCSKQYKTKQSLDIHLFEHTGDKKFKCDLCDKTFAAGFLVARHKRIHMEGSFQCKYCTKKFKSKHNLDRHIFEHTGVKQYKCDLCIKIFSTPFSLERHKIIHTDRSFQCKYCTKKYKSKTGLDCHLAAAHTGGKQFKCNLCDKTFGTLQTLEQHKHIHHMELSL